MIFVDMQCITVVQFVFIIHRYHQPSFSYINLFVLNEKNLSSTMYNVRQISQTFSVSGHVNYFSVFSIIGTMSVKSSPIT